MPQMDIAVKLVLSIIHPLVKLQVDAVPQIHNRVNVVPWCMGGAMNFSYHRGDGRLVNEYASVFQNVRNVMCTMFMMENV